MDGEKKWSRPPRSPRPDLCRRYARKELAANLPAILECFIEEASHGSIPHAKALMSLAGLDREEPVRPVKPRKGKSLSDLLLRELRKGNEAAEGSAE